MIDAIALSENLYKGILKPIFFSFDPEVVHHFVVLTGKYTGDFLPAKTLLQKKFAKQYKELSQTLNDISFASPVGLAAGFDYEANLPLITSSLGFGFHTVGTISYYGYKGNPAPRLGRLPKSHALMVNKGFKNLGAEKTVKKLEKKHFTIPVGVSIGKTNNPQLSLKQSVQDIVNCFMIFEKAASFHQYYEVNISCPNLYGTTSFYSSKNLSLLLKEIATLHLQKPLFVKMPINLTNKETLTLLDVISRFSPKGIIIGNLQKDKKNFALYPDEVAKWRAGSFSGKPTYERSNELISLAYRYYASRFTIIGCGGIFTPLDAYEKIKRGANLVQLITGLVFNGPQLVSDINRTLVTFLKRDGFKNIAQATGTYQNNK